MQNTTSPVLSEVQSGELASSPSVKVDTRAEIIRTLGLLYQPGDVFELRTIEENGPFKRTNYGYFDLESAEDCAKQALRFDSKASVYITINPCRNELLSRVCQRLKQAGKDDATKDHEIKQRRWLPIDLDALRPRDISASAEEATLAEAKSRAVRDALRARGFPEPIRAFSGNGCHLLYRIDLPNDEQSRVLVERCLKALAAEHDDERVAVDIKCKNAARLWKLYGTMAVKGDNTKERPHRRSRLLEVPETIETVSLELLEALAAEALEPQPAAPHSNAQAHADGNWLDTWLAKYFPDAGEPLPWKGSGRIWKLAVCPWDAQHTNTTSITEQPDGKIGASCFHNSCKGKGWPALRSLKEGSQQEIVSEPQRKSKCEPLRGKVLAEIEEEELEYIWKPWLPKLPSLVVGEEGIGKSLFLIYVMRCITTGSPFYDRYKPEKGRVMVFSAEDYAATVIKPRARIAGVDMSQVLIFEEPFMLTQSGLAKLVEAVEFYQPAWVFFDPVLAYFPTGMNPNNPADVRSITTQFSHICREHSCGITGLLHLNKSKGEGDARKAITTSGEWRNSARSVIYVGAHPEDRTKRAIYRRKTNHAAEQVNGLAFEIIGVTDEFAPLDEAGNRKTLPLFQIIGESTMSLEQTLASSQPEEGEATVIEDAIDFLKSELRESPVKSKQVSRDAKELGISERTLSRARTKLEAESHQLWDPTGRRNIWFLCLPGKWPSDPEKLLVKTKGRGRKPDPDGHISGNGHLGLKRDSKDTCNKDLDPDSQLPWNGQQGREDGQEGQEPGAAPWENWEDEPQ